jgi:2-dehydropantoate 2-reductase
MESKVLSDYALAVMNEIVMLSKKIGVRLPDTIISDAYQKGSLFPYETKTSFQRDFESVAKPDERDLYGGTILRLGKQFEVATPTTQELWHLLNRRKP